jgi:hypothetical protein
MTQVVVHGPKTINVSKKIFFISLMVSRPFMSPKHLITQVFKGTFILK